MVIVFLQCFQDLKKKKSEKFCEKIVMVKFSLQNQLNLEKYFIFNIPIMFITHF